MFLLGEPEGDVGCLVRQAGLERRGVRHQGQLELNMRGLVYLDLHLPLLALHHRVHQDLGRTVHDVLEVEPGGGL